MIFMEGEPFIMNKKMWILGTFQILFIVAACSLFCFSKKAEKEIEVLEKANNALYDVSIGEIDDFIKWQNQYQEEVEALEKRKEELNFMNENLEEEIKELESEKQEWSEKVAKFN